MAHTLGSAAQRGAVTVALALALAGCHLIGPVPRQTFRSPEVVCTPSVAGIVTALENRDGTSVYTLKDGTVVEFQANGVRRLTAGPAVGELLLYGEDASCGSFAARAIPGDPVEYPGCLEVFGNAASDDDHIILESGLRVPKAEGFEEPSSYVGGELRSAFACLSEQGEVLYFN